VDNRIVAQRTFDRFNDFGESGFPESLVSDQKLYVSVGSSIGISTRAENQNEPGAMLVELPDTSQLPTQWYGYEAVDTLIISTSDPSRFRQLIASGAQVEAIDEWVQLGGRLILCVGAEARSVLDSQAPLARFAPGALADVVTLKRGAALESFSGVSARVPPAGRGDALNLQVSQLKKIEGVTLVEEGNTPLVIR